ncbi:hypothetical protein ACFP0N_35175 [Kitasatospora aburaviensis]|uniref:Uncharacterized protein n=1 Tax=Kitasatospora aburaviensis TaxID=67265 RepID=A0ABW1F730_9ACTN
MARWIGQPGGLLLLPCGVSWDVVRMPERLGLPVLEALLGEAAETGPVLHDRDSQLVYALVTVEPGIDRAGLPSGVRLLSSGAYLAAPSPEMEWLNRSVVWAHMPAYPRPTDPARVVAALDMAARPVSPLAA